MQGADVQHTQETIVATAKVAPPVVATGMTVAGYPLSDWLILLTIIYTVMQILVLVHKELRERRDAECKLESDDDNSRGNP